jgi:outer membrane receptor protein involved in Fe transport
MRLHLEPGSQDATSVNTTENNEPGYQLMLQSQLRPFRNWRWDATVYQVGRRLSQNVDAYTRLDLGLAWRAFGNTELALQGTNLLQKRHLEDNGVLSGVLPTQVERSVTARITVGLGTE